MGIPIAELQGRISSRDFAEYWAHSKLEPWGVEHDDRRSGIVAATIANVNRDPKKRPQPYQAEDFMTTAIDVADLDDEEDPDEAEAAVQTHIDTVMVGLSELEGTDADIPRGKPVLEP